jgi:hypothetical protein
MELFKLPKISDLRGNLTFIEFPQQISFEINRVFWTYNVTCGESIRGHACKIQEEVIIALSGSFEVVITNPEGKIERIHLNRAYEGLHIPPMTWRHLENFSTNTVCLHLSSSVYNVNDYIRDFDDYIALK